MVFKIALTTLTTIPTLISHAYSGGTPSDHGSNNDTGADASVGKAQDTVLGVLL